MKYYKSIIYVNFSPYENTGNILDFIKDNFENIYSFTFDFHKFKKNNNSNKFRVYKNGRMKNEYNLLTIPVSESLIFLLLPMRSILILIQLLWYLFRIGNLIKKPVVFFTVNAFTAWVGNFLKTLGIVDKTIFWVWDYYPPEHSNKVIQFMRWLYWFFDRLGYKSDKLIFLNQRLINLRKKIGFLPNNKSYSIIPIGTEKIFRKHTYKSISRQKIILGFIGVLKKSQGLDIIFNQAPLLKKRFSNLSFHVIGDGPHKDYYYEISKNAGITTRFFGLLSEDIPAEREKIIKILSKCHIGLAPYKPEPGNVTYYGDPSKIKVYLSLGLPVITTNVFEFSEELQNNHAGILINYYKPKTLINALSKIITNYSAYVKGSRLLSLKYNYKKIYPKFFSMLQ